MVIGKKKRKGGIGAGEYGIGNKMGGRGKGMRKWGRGNKGGMGEAYYRLPIANCLSTVAYCLLPIAYKLLPVAYCLDYSLLPTIYI